MKGEGEEVRKWGNAPHKYGTLEGIARLLDLASKLGRLASGMPTDHTEVTGEVTLSVDLEWEVALKKVYGRPAQPPPRVIEAEVISETPKEEQR